MISGSLLLSNSEYLQNQAKFYSDLLECQELTDVTLACDGFEVGVHKTVISASSLFFRDVIKNSKNQNPFIYLKGVSKDTLESMLQFIYAGEATVMNENLEGLIEAGNELRVIGLMEVYNDDNLEKNQKNQKNEKMKKPKVAKISKQSTGITEMETTNESEKKAQQKKKDIQLLTNNSNNINNKNPDAGIFKESPTDLDLESEIDKRFITMKDGHDKTIHMCSVCNKEFKKKDKLRLHIETHLEGFIHKCNFCDAVKKTRGSLSFHEWHYHTGTNAKMTEVKSEL